MPSSLPGPSVLHFNFRVISGLDQIDVADAKSLSKFIKGNDCWIAPATFKAAQILLTVTRTSLDLFLCQALLPTQAGEIRADQFAHIHARKIAVYIL